MLLEIHSMEEFVYFVKFIRGEDLDEAKLAEYTARLKAANERQKEVVAANTPQS